MVGPNLSDRLHDEHRRYEFTNGDSNITLTLTSSIYGPEHHDGTAFAAGLQGSPDLVMIHNAAIFQYETWFGTIKMLSDRNQRTIITEPIETSIEIMSKHFVNINCTLTIPATVNPFKQPVYQWKKEVNLPGWSNGFITGFGDFSK
jgi:hypothetical protein